MLKKAIAMLIALPMSIGLGQSAIADETGGSGFSASVGLKTWISDWELPIYSEAQNKSDIDSVNTYNSDTETIFIPVLSFRYKNFFVSGSYFPKTDYNFNDGFFKGSYFAPIEGESLYYWDAEFGDWLQLSEVAAVSIPMPFHISSERSEWDINVGYYILPSLVATAGYKRIDRDFVFSWRYPDDFSVSTLDKNWEPVETWDVERFEAEGIATSAESKGDNKTEGWTVGISGVAPLQGRLGLYGSFAFGLLETTNTADTELDTNYYLGELGLLYSSQFSQIPMLDAAAVYLGYRFQLLDDELPIGVDAGDNTSGFVLGVNLVF
jgi:hypothetical protein